MSKKILTVQFNTVDDIKQFVHLVNRFPCNVDLVDGYYRIDAKSIMGIFSLKPGHKVNCEIWPEETVCQELINELTPYIITD